MTKMKESMRLRDGDSDRVNDYAKLTYRLKVQVR